MRSHRFYCPQELAVQPEFELPKEASHHCLQVLRCRVGQPLELFNGDGFDYFATITRIEGKRCLVDITARAKSTQESPLAIHLVQGIARGEKMDLIIQKAVELGVSQITPLFSERCNVKLDGKRLEKKQQHWQKVAVSACEQSGRSLVPKINPAQLIRQLQLANGTHLYLQPGATKRLSQSMPDGPVTLIIGPEGGFSDGDLQILDRQGCQATSLGPRILRTETAGLSSIAILQSHFGDL